MLAWEGEIEHSLESHDETTLKEVMGASARFVHTVQEMSKESFFLARKLMRVRRDIHHLSGSLEPGHLKTQALEFDREASKALRGNINDLRAALHSAGSWLSAMMARHQAEDKELEDGKTDLLLHLLYQRRRLPLRSQKAVLERDLFRDNKWSKRLQAHQGSSLYEEFRKCLIKEGHKVSDFALHPKRPLVITSRQRNLRDSTVKYLEKTAHRLGCPKDVAICRHVEAALKEVRDADIVTAMKVMKEIPARIEQWMAEEIHKEAH